MEIKCLRCKQEFDVSKEKLNKINEMIVGNILKPNDYLWMLPNFSTVCSSGKGHDFVFTDAFTDKKKTVIQEYDDVNKYMEASKESLKLMETREKELSDEKEKLTRRLDKIRDELFTNDQSINDIFLTKIPEDQVKLEKLLDSFEDLTGTRNIELWKDVVIPKVIPAPVSTEAKKEDKK